jgi:hypothetical protein
VTRALAGIFGEVHGVDVSGEMVNRARKLLAGCPNVFLHKNNGVDLSGLGDRRFDSAFPWSGSSTSRAGTWLGASFSGHEAVGMGRGCGFDPRYRSGAGERYYWVWSFKQWEVPA